MKTVRVYDNLKCIPVGRFKYFHTKEEAKRYVDDRTRNYLKRNWKTYRNDCEWLKRLEYKEVSKSVFEKEVRYIKSNYFEIERLHIKIEKHWW